MNCLTRAGELTVLGAAFFERGGFVWAGGLGFLGFIGFMGFVGLIGFIGFIGLIGLIGFIGCRVYTAYEAYRVYGVYGLGFGPFSHNGARCLNSEVTRTRRLSKATITP